MNAQSTPVLQSQAPGRAEAVRRARETRARRLGRIARIRRTVAGVTAAVFVALFSTIYVQMAAGNDPVLGKTSAAGDAATAQGSTSSGTDSSSASSTGSSSTSDQASSDQTSAVTTAQS